MQNNELSYLGISTMIIGINDIGNISIRMDVMQSKEYKVPFSIKLQSNISVHKMIT